MDRQAQFTLQQLNRLVGKKVEAVALDQDTGIGSVFGLKFTDGTTAWVLQDPEGNGPGWLEVCASNAPNN